MAPPGLFNTKEVQSKNNNHGQKPASKKPDQVDEDSQDPAQDEGFPFPQLSAELQHMIWGEAMQKPACHTFKVHKSRQPGPWVLNLHAIPQRYDTSAYRGWKSLLYTTQGDNEKLKNISFQTGFRRAMIKFQRIEVRVSGHDQTAAAIDVATDLVILEFERGARIPVIGWFMHWQPLKMNINTIRHDMRHFKRVAIHYKSNHQGCTLGGPFRCYCGPGLNRGCARFKVCYYELGCFLDCFPNLEEFYFVVETKGKEQKDWAKQYRERVREKKYSVAKPKHMGGGPFELSHFFDAKKEYIQHCPRIFWSDLADKIASSPILRPGGPRECLLNAMKLYRGEIHTEGFRNSQEMRKKVKFGLLLEYPLEGK